MSTRGRDILKLVASIAVAEIAGGIGAIFTVSAIPSWYALLAKPPLTPPGWVFGPVWNVLYLMMGVAAFLVWRGGWHRREVRVALGIFLFQLALNVLWSVIFFGLRRPGFAVLDIIALWLAIAWTTGRFREISEKSAWLLAPYLAWVTFASYLNIGLWLLNR